MESPVNNSDMNPIEQLWFTLERAIRERQPIQNFQQLEELIQEWELLPQERIPNWIKYVPSLC
ncbi:hypothetical protein BDFB_015286 [Asbolus verrucosus]|uniref:Uncharacterized protein n=1 Tax=Asbolus verrucosus TaxID=1661398 RepID=A0A482VB27_ASBVE|nr:hypothetical protein BDFB_015286 [Asbolus verrucosus]